MKRLLIGLIVWAVTTCSFAYEIYQGPPPGKFSDTMVLVTPNASAVGVTNPLHMQYGDSPSIDASNRLRVGNTFGLFEDTRTDGLGTMVWEDVASGVGATSTWNSNEATVTLTVGTGNNDYEYRQTRYLSYIAGASQLAKLTFVMGAGVTNVAKRVGLFDDSDGLFLQQLGNTVSVCVRSSTSGSPVDTCTAQSSWNLDKLNGTGPSGVTLDLTKSQLLVIDYLWQGVGRVRYGFLVDGQIYYVHQVLNANRVSLPYTANPSLPVRFEIRNIGTSAGATMKEICVSIESEDGYTVPGFEYAVSTGITPIAVTTRAPVLGIRLQNSYNGKSNRKTVRLLHQTLRAVTNDALCELVHIHFPSSVTGGSWVPASNGDSGVEYNTGITAITAAVSHVVDTNFVISGQGQAAGALSSTLEFINYHGMIYQNAASTNSQMFVLYCTAFSGTSNISAELNWIEFK